MTALDEKIRAITDRYLRGRIEIALVAFEWEAGEDGPEMTYGDYSAACWMERGGRWSWVVYEMDAEFASGDNCGDYGDAQNAAEEVIRRRLLDWLKQDFDIECQMVREEFAS